MLRWGRPAEYAYHLAIHNGLASFCQGAASSSEEAASAAATAAFLVRCPDRRLGVCCILKDSVPDEARSLGADCGLLGASRPSDDTGRFGIVCKLVDLAQRHERSALPSRICTPLRSARRMNFGITS